MKDFAVIGSIVMAAIGSTAFLLGAFITHIVWCIQTASETASAIALLSVGVLMPPVGMIHGVALWLGFTWI